MYEWKAVKTSGGRILYARTLAKQREHEDLVASYKSNETKFNARLSEWDFFEDFDPDNRTGKRGSDSKDNEDKIDQSITTNALTNIQHGDGIDDAPTNTQHEGEIDLSMTTNAPKDTQNEDEIDQSTIIDTPTDTQILNSQQVSLATMPVVPDDTMEFYATAAVEDYPPHSPTSIVENSDCHSQFCKH